eukprot:CAMPEP_0117559862 /NCGR_PEP_ID=MMETSP0784-20121206/53577_1 /TAXON_ID=39447 /ORGANISM="" /LENGTH=136 /DNA_ID=CAMNT_0005357249 /DNA_START=171 /DNA_END=580 /DNA_ORIENTATION=+
MTTTSSRKACSQKGLSNRRRHVNQGLRKRKHDADDRQLHEGSDQQPQRELLEVPLGLDLAVLQILSRTKVLVARQSDYGDGDLAQINVLDEHSQRRVQYDVDQIPLALVPITCVVAHEQGADEVQAMDPSSSDTLL